MADEDLLIGGAKQEEAKPTAGPQGATSIQVPMDIVKVSVFAVFKEQPADAAEKGEEYVEQVFPQVGKPRNASDEDIAHFIWITKILPQAVLRTVGSSGEVNIYPLDRFKRFTIKVGSIVGVTV